MSDSPVTVEQYQNIVQAQNKIDNDLRRCAVCRSISDVSSVPPEASVSNDVKKSKSTRKDEDEDSDNSISESLNNYLDSKVGSLSALIL